MQGRGGVPEAPGSPGAGRGTSRLRSRVSLLQVGAVGNHREALVRAGEGSGNSQACRTQPCVPPPPTGPFQAGDSSGAHAKGPPSWCGCTFGRVSLKTSKAGGSQQRSWAGDTPVLQPFGALQRGGGVAPPVRGWPPGWGTDTCFPTLTQPCPAPNKPLACKGAGGGRGSWHLGPQGPIRSSSQVGRGAAGGSQPSPAFWVLVREGGPCLTP